MNSIEEDIKIIEKYLSHFKKVCSPEMLKKDEIIKVIQYKEIQALQHILTNYKRVLKENKTYKKQYFGLIDKIENKIDKFDYEFEKAKRKNDNDRADYYWDLIRNFIKILESEE